MGILVEEAKSAAEYLEAWRRIARTMQWFKERRLFDYSPEEIMEDTKKAFDKPENFFLIAKQVKSPKTVGVLGIIFAGNVATCGRWEPAVALKHRRNGIGEMLLEAAFSHLRKQRVSKVRCILKFPYGKPQRAGWHTRLYQKCGFTLERPSSVLSLADLSTAKSEGSSAANLRILSDTGFTLEEYADFTQRAYMLTPEDRQVHQSDNYISKRENLLKVLEALKMGKLGLSPSECWKVAMVDERVAGFIVGFIRKETRFCPTYGVIAELGVFPEFRGTGVGMALVAELFKVFRKHGCAYSFVGTPKINKPALSLYRKTGHFPVFEQMDFQRIL